MSILAGLDNLGSEKLRRALALAAMGFIGSFCTLVALGAPPPLVPAFAGLALCYVVAFLGVAIEWFWARWFAVGLGWWGVMLGVLTVVMQGWVPPLVVSGVLHGIVVLALSSEKMAKLYDLQEGWRSRWNMDEFGVARLRKTVTRASMSVPILILWALGPREGGMALMAGVLGLAGLAAVVRLRTWGVLALGGAAAVALTGPAEAPVLAFGAPMSLSSSAAGILAGAALVAALIPLGRPILAHLRRPA